MIFALLLLAASAPQKGRLVVVAVIDQLRYQDVLWLAPELGSRGFAGLGTPAPMRYDTVVTETAADHAVLSTGAYADMNGVVGNRFYVEGARRELVEDPSCPVWGAPQIGRSSAMLRVPTVGDAFKLGTDGAGRVVSVAVKDRSALFLAGASADLAVWFELETGEMASTTCYAPGPPPWLPQHVLVDWKDWVWTMSRPDAIARLVPQARNEGSRPANDVGAEFPHPVGNGKIDKRLALAARNSPAASTSALRTASAAVKAMALGESNTTDLLFVALSSVDGVGHQFGTLTRERVDTILRTHDELGAFLSGLRARLGKRLSVLLTSDHGLNPTASDERRLRVGQGGTIDLDGLIQKLNRALDEQIGLRREGWVLAIDGSQLWLRSPFPPKAVQAAVEVLRREPGLWKVIPADEIDAAESFVRHSWFAGRSGQAMLVTRPLWTMKKAADAADHGSPWNDDALVPVSLQAPGFRLRRNGVIRATQIAPAIAALLDAAPPAAALDDPAIEHE
ncbi:MAG: hypothetical protein E6J78_07505 [Deltaproteobacteria bacterium]|nr:MAG: hypothetical protein E6J78_07505 [Deltaproteobacteria bacterium]